ncbi:MAG: ABC transporter ATP-binding protein [Planctomycetota bacterium]
MNYAIETFSLQKDYSRGRVHALRNVSLRVPRGSCFGLLGPNGAGKSTLVKTLLSIVRPTSGSATLLGKDSRDPEARRGVGYLPEGHNFPRYLTGAGVCRYFGKLAGLRGAHLEGEIAQKLELVGMTERARDRVRNYSKGMKQRVGLAQALLGDPHLVFLDEPTDGVDPVGRQQIRGVIRAACERGSTVFLNSHLLHEVEVLCDQVAILDRGRLLVSGSVQAILADLQSAKTGVAVGFRTGPIPDALWVDLGARGATREDAGVFRIHLASEDEISGIIDLLRTAGVSIFGVSPTQVKLEDAFVELLARHGAKESAQ